MADDNKTDILKILGFLVGGGLIGQTTHIPGALIEKPQEISCKELLNRERRISSIECELRLVKCDS